MHIKQHSKYLLLVAVLLLAACDPKVDTRGYVSNVAWKDHVTIGKTTKDEIFSTFGSPSSQSSFGDETWYYISERKEAVAFFKPEVVSQDVVRMTFDANGVIKSMDMFDKNSSKEFAVTKRVTPTEGHQLGFFEQIVGNVGRFNKGGDGPTGAPRRH